LGIFEINLSVVESQFTLLFLLPVTTNAVLFKKGLISSSKPDGVPALADKFDGSRIAMARIHVDTFRRPFVLVAMLKLL
jgi:hypothetical protein